MLENNDDFENFNKNFSQGDEDELIINDNETEAESSQEPQGVSMEDIFADIPPMPSDYEETSETMSAAFTSSKDDENETVTVQPVKFASFDDAKSLSGDASKNLDNLLDIKLQLTVELGRTTLPVKKVLELTRGSIVELEKIAGEPVELYANGKLIAHGEVVVIEDNFGLRITSMSEPENKLNGLQ